MIVAIKSELEGEIRTREHRSNKVWLEEFLIILPVSGHLIGW